MPCLKQLRESAQNYLTKLFSPDDLGARVKNILLVNHTREILQKEVEERILSIEILAKKVSEQKRALEHSWSEVCATNKLKDQFLMLVVHELRTPLTPILGYLDLLQHTDKNSPDFAEYLEIIQRNAYRQAKLINDLLDITWMLSGKLKINEKQVSLSAVIEKAIVAIQLDAKAKDIQVKINAASSPCQIRGDEERLVQVLWNILANAVRYTPRAGIISMEVQQNKQEILLSITDSGPGFEADFLPHAFEWFKQAPTSDSIGGGEFGVGLAVARYLIEAHRGNVKAENKKSGASVIISLPVIAEHEDD